MPLIVHSPYSGLPVKVRDQDVERAIRDASGRVFYVVSRSNGKGHYASPTRKGSAKDEAKYDELLGKIERGELSAIAPEETADARPAVHDATGRPRSVSRTKLIILVLAILVALAVVYFTYVTPAQGSTLGAPGTTTQLAQVQPLPTPGSGAQRASGDEDPQRVAARQRYTLRVFAAGGAIGLVIIFLVARYGNRKHAERMKELHG